MNFFIENSATSSVSVKDLYNFQKFDVFFEYLTYLRFFFWQKFHVFYQILQFQVFLGKISCFPSKF